MEEHLIYPYSVIELDGLVHIFRIIRYNTVLRSWTLCGDVFANRNEAQNLADELNRESGPVSISLNPA